VNHLFDLYARTGLRRLGAIGFALFACLSANAAFATTYYVDASNPNGSGDDNSCVAAQSISSPKLTINGGISCMVGGDTLNVRAGTYNDSINSNIPSGTGFPTGATRLQGYPGDAMPTMNGSLTLAAENNIIWTGININDAGDSGNTTDCILINSGSNILITQSDISNCQRHGILTDDGNFAPLSNLTFSYLKVHNTGQGALVGASDPRHHNFYISAHIFTTGPIIIDHVESYNTGNPANSLTGGPSGSAGNSWGISIYSASPGFLNGVVVSNSYIHDNNEGIVVGSGPNHLVFNNVLWNNDSTSSYGEGAITVAYGDSTMDNIQVYNNTIVANKFGAYGISVGTYGTPTNTLIKNNILWQNGNDSINLAGGTGTITANNWMGVDPLFVSYLDDFHLQSSSPARSTAVNLSSIFTIDTDGHIRPATGDWDAGAYVAVVSSPTQGLWPPPPFPPLPPLPPPPPPSLRPAPTHGHRPLNQ
jgi:hypothetical protein